jgi:hypothetical protein
MRCSECSTTLSADDLSDKLCRECQTKQREPQAYLDLAEKLGSKLTRLERKELPR